MGRSIHDDSLRSTTSRVQAGERVPDQSQRHTRSHDSRAVYCHARRNYHLNSSQAAMLQDVGTFRAVTAESLRKHLYQGDTERFKKDLANLTDQRLMRVHSDSRSRDRYVSLTKEGKGVTEIQLRSNASQSLYSGVVKTRELRHDAAIYEVYQKEARQILQSGGTPDEFHEAVLRVTAGACCAGCRHIHLPTWKHLDALE